LGPRNQGGPMKQLVLCENNKYYAYARIGGKMKLIGEYTSLTAAQAACRQALHADMMRLCVIGGEPMSVQESGHQGLFAIKNQLTE
jgi:hypothetical protein